MLRLILTRHGKSSWDDPDLDDFHRPLAPRGLRNVPEMGRRLARRGTPPDLIVTSTAVRALSTARALARELDYAERRIEPVDALYLASPLEILEIVRALPRDAKTVLVVGHNPGMTEFANLVDRVRLDNMPTTGMLCVEFDVDEWQSVEPARGRFAWFDYPKKQPD